MSNIRSLSAFMTAVVLVCMFPEVPGAKPAPLNARSAILMDMTEGRVLFEQNADTPIAPASVTKILTLYIVFDAIKAGQIHPWDKVKVSKKAARTGGSRMGLQAGKEVPLEELIKGMAVVSGNDACVAVAEHMAGNVDEFVRRMNAKARELGMKDTVFKTPNGLPAKGQVTTARDMATLSLAYLRRFPESLTIHSMRSYTYNKATHHNANRLLGKCSGVDGIKTGFVCASGFNLSATAKRGDSRLIAVVMGAPSAWVRACETAKLLEKGFQQVAPDLADTRVAQGITPPEELSSSGEAQSCPLPGKSRLTKKAKSGRYGFTQRTTADKAQTNAAATHSKGKGDNLKSSHVSVKARGTEVAREAKVSGKDKNSKAVKHVSVYKETTKSAKMQGTTGGDTGKTKRTSTTSKAPKENLSSGTKSTRHENKRGAVKRVSTTQESSKACNTHSPSQAASSSTKKNGTSQKTHPQT